MILLVGRSVVVVGRKIFLVVVVTAMRDTPHRAVPILFRSEELPHLGAVEKVVGLTFAFNARNIHHGDFDILFVTRQNVSAIPGGQGDKGGRPVVVGAALLMRTALKDAFPFLVERRSVRAVIVVGVALAIDAVLGHVPLVGVQGRPGVNAQVHGHVQVSTVVAAVVDRQIVGEGDREGRKVVTDTADKGIAGRCTSSAAGACGGVGGRGGVRRRRHGRGRGGEEEQKLSFA